MLIGSEGNTRELRWQTDRLGGVAVCHLEKHPRAREGCWVKPVPGNLVRLTNSMRVTEAPFVPVDKDSILST